MTNVDDALPIHGDSLASEGPARGEAVERVVRELRGAILNGELLPGTKIGQVELARRLGTSRLPVREALRQLHHEGLVAFVPNAGARVSQFKASELDEIYRLREVIEPMLIAESVSHLSDADIELCARYAEEMEELASRGPANAAAWLDIDFEFHRTTFNGVHMRQAMRIVEGLWNMVAHYRLMYAQMPRAYEFTHLEHRLLVDALERRNADDAARVLELHIRRTRLGLGKALTSSEKESSQSRRGRRRVK
jgi:DNA-binding GntR family transcriptional regulator